MSWLTKSLFLAGLQCPKRLWFEVHEPLEEGGDGEATDSMALVNGRIFDRLVQDLLPGVVVSRDGGVSDAIAQTRRLFSADAPEVVHQAAFKAGDLAVVADVVRRRGRGYVLVEIKVAGEIKQEHLSDVAFQALVLRGARVRLSRCYLGHINKKFRLKRRGDYRGLLIEEDVSGQVRKLLPAIAKAVAASVRVLREPSAPDVSMGAHCEDPRPCPFMERCAGACPPPSQYPLSILPRGGRIVQELLDEGFTDLRTVPAERLRNAVHIRVHAASVSGVAHFQADAVREVRKLTPPFAYLDFETLNLAVPEVVGTRPYEQWPFQWSLHVEAADGSLAHHDFLAEEFGDFEALTEELLTVLPKRGPIFVYNLSLEAGVLERLAKHLPKRAKTLRAVVARLVDLWPITKAAYYHPEMRGSWSLKAVAPTLDPQLAYEGLEEVAEGGAAQLAYLEFRDPATSAERRSELKERLRLYCARDTDALVVLRRFLCGARS